MLTHPNMMLVDCNLRYGSSGAPVFAVYPPEQINLHFPHVVHRKRAYLAGIYCRGIPKCGTRDSRFNIQQASKIWSICHNLSRESQRQTTASNTTLESALSASGDRYGGQWQDGGLYQHQGHTGNANGNAFPRQDSSLSSPETDSVFFPDEPSGIPITQYLIFL